MIHKKQLVLEPIGYAETPFHARYDAPHQPGGHDPDAIGIIRLLPGKNFEQAVEDLEGMEKIWLLYWFDRNETWKPKVQVPRGERKKRGLFATRSPHRPNPVGLSLVDLVEVEGLTLKVRTIDLLDGTPILDIKPYLPYLEAHPNARAGWIDAAQSQHTSPKYTISWEPLAQQQLDFLEGMGVHLRDHVERILSRDPLPHPYKRIEACGDGHVIALRAWRIYYSIDGDSVTIARLGSGYAQSEIESTKSGELSDDAAQREFIRRWLA